MPPSHCLPATMPAPLLTLLVVVVGRMPALPYLPATLGGSFLGDATCKFCLPVPRWRRVGRRGRDGGIRGIGLVTFLAKVCLGQ